jgi:hypothetical protein
MIENSLKAGNITISGKESNRNLTYYFSKRLIETNADVSKELQEIKDWLLGNQRSCIEAIKSIINNGESSSVELVPCPKNFYLSWISRNPEVVIKYLFLGILAILALLASPSLVGNIISHL